MLLPASPQPLLASVSQLRAELQSTLPNLPDDEFVRVYKAVQTLSDLVVDESVRRDDLADDLAITQFVDYINGCEGAPCSKSCQA